MTDRHMGYVVTLEQNIREDDAEATLAALRQIKGVLSVEPIVADALQESIGHSRGAHEVIVRVMEALREARKSS